MQIAPKANQFAKVGCDVGDINRSRIRKQLHKNLGTRERVA
jgi:hypothetical protein